MVVAALVACVVVGALDACQAITGKRISRRPSRRTDDEMRRQSAIAAVDLAVLAIALLVVLIVQ